jgi:hypothetical protein
VTKKNFNIWPMPKLFIYYESNLAEILYDGKSNNCVNYLSVNFFRTPYNDRSIYSQVYFVYFISSPQNFFLLAINFIPM